MVGDSRLLRTPFVLLFFGVAVLVVSSGSRDG
jgi:hypothetical protein